ncbi:type II toxin-antitoxin system RelE/ParE family toxin [Pigmentiphaga sp. YJ18]|uniref:type II toxin-antitoxin system RelE/ParE family toxin n=1 Tax=Pigmentiphaga sp. YJ18 TaxID=3134907 RepID=UPI003114D261
MPRVIWTPLALDDVQSLYRFLAQKDISAARRAVQAIRAGVRMLARQPRVGRPIEDMDAEFREWLIDFGPRSYVVLYQLHGETASILAVRLQKEVGY